jgi:hypothetical protein
MDVTDPRQILFKIVRSHTAGGLSVMLVSLDPLGGFYLDRENSENSRIEFTWDLVGEGVIEDIGSLIGDYQQKQYGRPKYGTYIYDSFREFRGKVKEYTYERMLDPEMHHLIRLLFKP